MRYCITAIQTRGRITGRYDGSDEYWSTDHIRQKLFDKKRNAKPMCRDLRDLWPRNAAVINIEADSPRWCHQCTLLRTRGTA